MSQGPGELEKKNKKIPLDAQPPALIGWNKVIWGRYRGAWGAKWWDRRSLLLFHSAVRHPAALTACAAVNTEIYYSPSASRTLGNHRCTPCNSIREEEEEEKNTSIHAFWKFAFAAPFALWMQRDTLIRGDLKTLRCFWWLVNHNKWCNRITRAFKEQRPESFFFFISPPPECPECAVQVRAEVMPDEDPFQTRLDVAANSAVVPSAGH